MGHPAELHTERGEHHNQGLRLVQYSRTCDEHGATWSVFTLV